MFKKDFSISANFYTIYFNQLKNKFTICYPHMLDIKNEDKQYIEDINNYDFKIIESSRSGCNLEGYIKDYISPYLSDIESIKINKYDKSNKCYITQDNDDRILTELEELMQNDYVENKSLYFIFTNNFGDILTKDSPIVYLRYEENRVYLYINNIKNIIDKNLMCNEDKILKEIENHESNFIHVLDEDFQCRSISFIYNNYKNLIDKRYYNVIHQFINKIKLDYLNYYINIYSQLYDNIEIDQHNKFVIKDNYFYKIKDYQIKRIEKPVLLDSTATLYYYKIDKNNDKIYIILEGIYFKIYKNNIPLIYIDIDENRNMNMIKNLLNMKKIEEYDILQEGEYHELMKLCIRNKIKDNESILSI